MNGEGADLLALCLPAIIAVMGAATLLAALRILRGPSLADRVVGLDLVGTLAIGGSAIYAILENEPVYLTISVVLALLLFVGTVAFAYYILRGTAAAAEEEEEEEEEVDEEAKPAHEERSP